MDSKSNPTNKICFSCSRTIFVILLCTIYVISCSLQHPPYLKAVAQSGTNNTLMQDQKASSTINKTMADQVAVLNGRAIAYFYSKNFDEAITLSDQALSIDPNNLDALSNKAVALFNAGKSNETIAV